MESRHRASASPLASHAAFPKTSFLPVYIAQRLLLVPVVMGVGHPCRAASCLSLKFAHSLFIDDRIGEFGQPVALASARENHGAAAADRERRAAIDIRLEHIERIVR